MRSTGKGEKDCDGEVQGAEVEGGGRRTRGVESVDEEVRDEGRR
jgi:hypothetical protein